MPVRAHRPAATGLHAGARYTRVGLSTGGPAGGDTVARIYALVAPEMAESERLLHAQLDPAIPAVAEIGRYLAGAGGKRLRPLVTALGARAVGLTSSPARLMCVGELVHLGSLLHDDVVDEGQERRGLPAAQRVYGNPGVILTGDYCVASGLTVAAEEAGAAAVTRLARTVMAMSEGEVTQLLAAGQLKADLATYLEIIQKKSAALIAWCAASGAWAAGDASAAEALWTYGEKVGAAFQITDDVLDYAGERRLTGKRAGRDLAEPKLTLPLLLAMERIPGLRERLLAAPPAEDELPALLEAVRASGACDDALASAREWVEQGVAALGALPDTPARSALIALAHYLVERIR